MPPVDRKNPKRAASSESQFSVMEFTRHFPDDDACLDYLWRTRYSPDGEHAPVPRLRGRACLQALHRQATAAGVDVRGLWALPLRDGRDDLSQVVHVASPVVLCHVPHVEHSLWHFCQAT